MSASSLLALYNDPLGPPLDHEPAPSPKRAPKSKWKYWVCLDAIFAALARGALSHLEANVGFALARCANSKTGLCFPSVKALR
jgi:hypothetical protein